MNIIKKGIIKFIWECKRIFYYVFPNIALIYNGKLESNIWNVRIYQKVYMYKKGGIYKIGDCVQFGYDIGGRNRRGYCELQARNSQSKIIIGDYSAINNNCCFISCSMIQIGQYCRIGVNCQIIDFDGHSIDPLKRSKIGNIADVYIGDNVWIGNNVVVAAGAVVKGEFGDNVLIGGVPARIIRKIKMED